MDAKVGDRLVVRGHQLGEVERMGEILEIHGHDGEPPYLVRWNDGHESVFFPSSDTVVRHRPVGSAADPGA